MTTKHQPATPLPWHIDPQQSQDKRYQSHAANAYPRLVGTLEDILEWLETGKVYGLGFDEQSIKVAIDDLLHDLGEL